MEGENREGTIKEGEGFLGRGREQGEKKTENL